jgi:hypothetical protein
VARVSPGRLRGLDAYTTVSLARAAMAASSVDTDAFEPELDEGCTVIIDPDRAFTVGSPVGRSRPGLPPRRRPAAPPLPPAP